MLRLILALILVAGAASAQDSMINFGGFQQNSGEPIEVVSNQLDVDQEAGTAVFTGEVTATQGELSLTGERVEVFYTTGEDRRIRRLYATGGVTLVTSEEAAEAEEADYEVIDGTILMVGDVLVTQGESAIAGERMTIDMDTGTGRVEGRVRTIFQTGE
ncbi:lipopolysaccharide transport periplasmic protein LptA [Palleronia sp.]|uniref:lipopolysaccharide transport periplasmic protein LptA n=1 Tax=Palleronia sp. TaxID=1940284 RepID=UPI0035C7A06B